MRVDAIAGGPPGPTEPRPETFDAPLDMTLPSTHARSPAPKSNEPTFCPVQLNFAGFADGQVDFPYINVQSVPIDDSQLKEGLQYICYITNNGVIEADAPEFVDLNELELPVFEVAQEGDEKKDDTENTGNEQPLEPPAVQPSVHVSSGEDGDDVVFVTCYTAAVTTHTPTVTTASSSASATPTDAKPQRKRRRRRRTVAVPRRNPKRVAQMEKASMDLAMKLSMPTRIFNAKITRNTPKVDSSKLCRQSCRNTGAVLCPPSPLTSKDWKDWPVDMHDMPVYDPGKSQSPRRRPLKQTKPSTSETTKSLGQLTHETLHSVLGYVSNVTRFNAALREAGLTRLREEGGGEEEEEEGGEFRAEWRRLGKEKLERNVEDACELLFDTCKLYCVANDVSEEDMVKYVESLGKEEIERVLEENKENCSEVKNGSDFRL